MKSIIPELLLSPPDMSRGGDDSDRNSKPKNVRKWPKKRTSLSAKLPAPVSAIIDDSKESVFELLWEEKRQFVRDALQQRFWISENTPLWKDYIESVANWVTNTWLFEDITNRWVGIIYSNLQSWDYGILEQLITLKNHRVLTFEEQLTHYATYAVKRKALPQDRLDEYIQFLREEVYFAPSAQEYDRQIAEVNILLDEMRAQKLSAKRKTEVFKLLFEKTEHISNKVIRRR